MWTLVVDVQCSKAQQLDVHGASQTVKPASKTKQAQKAKSFAELSFFACPGALFFLISPATFSTTVPAMSAPLCIVVPEDGGLPHATQAAPGLTFSDVQHGVWSLCNTGVHECGVRRLGYGALGGAFLRPGSTLRRLTGGVVVGLPKGKAVVAPARNGRVGPGEEPSACLCVFSKRTNVMTDVALVGDNATVVQAGLGVFTLMKRKRSWHVVFQPTVSDVQWLPRCPALDAASKPSAFLFSEAMVQCGSRFHLRPACALVSPTCTAVYAWACTRGSRRSKEGRSKKGPSKEAKYGVPAMPETVADAAATEATAAADTPPFDAGVTWRAPLAEVIAMRTKKRPREDPVLVPAMKKP